MTLGSMSELAALQGGTDTRTALAFYDTLAPVAVDRILGCWRGRGLHTGHPFDGLLERFGWYGKRFDGPEEAHPLLFTSSEGAPFAVDPARIPLSLLISHAQRVPHHAAAGLVRIASGLVRTHAPQARLRMTEYRGIVSATMIYDAWPVNDIFRAAGPDTLVGAMDMRGVEQPLMFVLRREFRNSS